MSLLSTSSFLFSVGTDIGIPAGNSNRGLPDQVYTNINRVEFSTLINKRKIAPAARVRLEPNPQIAFNRGVGTASRSFGSIFFGYLHYTLDAFEFGIIPEDESLTATIWNARVEGQGSVAVTAVSLPTDTSLTITQPANAPYTILELQEIKYTILAKKSGNPSLDTKLVLTFTGEPQKTWLITGLRIILFGWSPDWSSPVEQEFIWKTDVITAFDGTEQRVKLRQNPWMKLSYNILIDKAHSQSFLNTMVSWGDKPFGLPIWVDKQAITESLVPASLAIKVDDVTGSNYYNTRLIYIPFTGKVYSITNIVSSDHPDNTNQVHIITPAINEIKQYEYRIPDAHLIDVTITGTLPTGHVFTVLNLDNTTLVQQISGALNLSYTLKRGNFKFKTNTNATAATALTITLKDRRQTGVITLPVGVGAAIPAGSFIYPVQIAHLKDLSELESSTDDTKTAEVTLVTNPLPNFATVAEANEFKNSIVETKKPEWSQPLNQGISTGLSIKNNFTGLHRYDLRDEFIGSVYKRREILYKSIQVRQFLEESQLYSGKLRTVWLPTYTRDITVVADMATAATVMVVAEAAHKLLRDKGQDYRNIRIQMTDGLVFYRTIAAVSVTGLNESITIDAALDKAREVSEFELISYMSLVRSSSDSVTLVWETDEFATVEKTYEGVLQ